MFLVKTFLTPKASSPKKIIPVVTTYKPKNLLAHTFIVIP